MAVSGLGSQYGNYNPAAVDPYPIETTLANKATPDSAQAQSMLELYQMQRQANANIYGQELDKQHEFNRQQLRQQLVEAQMKAIPEYAKTPGGARFLASGGGAQYGLGGDDGSGALTNLADAGDQAQQAVNFEKSGAGWNSYAQGGYQINPQQMPGMAGMQGTLTDPASVRAAQIRASATLAAARIHAAAQGSPYPHESTSILNPEFGTFTNLSRPKGATDEQWRQIQIQHGAVPIDDQGPARVAPPAAGDGTATQPAPVAKGGATTNLPPAASGGGPKPSNTAAGASAAGKQFSDWLDKSSASKEVKDDIRAGMAKNNGQPIFKPDPTQGNRMRLYGASNQPYT